MFRINLEVGSGVSSTAGTGKKKGCSISLSQKGYMGCMSSVGTNLARGKTGRGVFSNVIQFHLTVHQRSIVHT